MDQRDGELGPTHDFEAPVDRQLKVESETTYAGDPKPQRCID